MKAAQSSFEMRAYIKNCVNMNVLGPQTYIVLS